MKRHAVRQVALAACLLAMSKIGFTGPAQCSYGAQDSTCVGRLNSGWQSPPACSTGAGWTTVAAARWIGSQYTQPQCNYQAPPTCPNGYITAAGAWWNGSSWVGLNCQVPPPPACPSGQNMDVAPTWNGSAWVGMSCSVPWVPPAVNPEQACRSYVTQQLGFWPGWGVQNSVFDDGTNTTFITNTYNTSFNTYQYAMCSASDSTGAVTGYDVQGYGDTAGMGG